MVVDTVATVCCIADTAEHKPTAHGPPTVLVDKVNHFGHLRAHQVCTIEEVTLQVASEELGRVFEEHGGGAARLKPLNDYDVVLVDVGTFGCHEPDVHVAHLVVVTGCVDTSTSFEAVLLIAVVAHTVLCRGQAEIPDGYRLVTKYKVSGFPSMRRKLHQILRTVENTLGVLERDQRRCRAADNRGIFTKRLVGERRFKDQERLADNRTTPDKFVEASRFSGVPGEDGEHTRGIEEAPELVLPVERLTVGRSLGTFRTVGVGAYDAVVRASASSFGHRQADGKQRHILHPLVLLQTCNVVVCLPESRDRNESRGLVDKVPWDDVRDPWHL